MGGKAEYDSDPIDGLPRLKVQDWAERKHRLLTQYIEASSYARKEWPRRTYIDLYCGPGKCVDKNGKVSDGSTLAALRAARIAPFTEVYISDLEVANVEACASRLEQIGCRPTMALAEPASTAVERVASCLNPKALHLAFLDPFSLHALPFSVIDRLTKFNKIDLLIHFSAMDFARNYKRLVREDSIDLYIPGASQNYDERRTLRDNRRRAFALWYQALLDRKFFSSNVEMVKGKGRHMYWLIHATRNKTALGIWNDIQRRDKQKGFDF